VVAAWAVNALAREDPEGIRALIELGDALRTAHRRAVSGGDVEPFRAATEERRQLVNELTRKSAAILERAGGATTATTDAIAGTLEAATVDEETWELVRAGRLTKPVRPPATFAGAAPGLEVGRPVRRHRPRHRGRSRTPPGCDASSGGRAGSVARPPVEPSVAIRTWTGRSGPGSLRAAEAELRRSATQAPANALDWWGSLIGSA
jgi:hypothetical protein